MAGASDPCGSCGGKGEWTVQETRTGQVWDDKLKEMVDRDVQVTVEVRCSGPCGGTGIVYK